MKGWFAGLVGFAIVIGLLVIAYLTQATWEASARNRIPVYDSMSAVTYQGPADKAPQPAFGLHTGEKVRVLWDLREGGARLCYLRLADGRRGWSSCNELQPINGVRVD